MGPRTKNASQNCWPNTSHAVNDTKCIWASVFQIYNIKCLSTCVDQTPPMPTRHLNMRWPKPACASQLVFTQSHSMLARTQNALQHVLTKPLICQREHKMYLNSCSLNPSNVSETAKCISTCLTKIILRQGIHKMHLNTWWSKISNASENTKKYWSSNVSKGTKSSCWC